MIKFYNVIAMFAIQSPRTKKIGIRVLYSFDEMLATNIASLFGNYGVAKTLDYLKSRHTYIDCFDFFGATPLQDSTIPVLSNDYFSHPCFATKTLRSFNKIAPLLKTKYSWVDINPIQMYKNIVTYDNPFVYYNGRIICKWMPYFEDNVSLSSVSLKDGFLCYNYKQNIYILDDTGKRHIPAELEEAFIINLASGKITLRRKYIENLHYYEESYIWGSNGWNCIKFSEKEITGYKKA